MHHRPYNTLFQQQRTALLPPCTPGPGCRPGALLPLVPAIGCRLGERFGEHAQFGKQRALQLLRAKLLATPVESAQVPHPRVPRGMLRCGAVEFQERCGACMVGIRPPSGEPEDHMPSCATHRLHGLDRALLILQPTPPFPPSASVAPLNHLPSQLAPQCLMHPLQAYPPVHPLARLPNRPPPSTRPLQYEFHHRLLAFLYAASRAPLSTPYAGSTLVEALEAEVGGTAAGVGCSCMPGSCV